MWFHDLNMLSCGTQMCWRGGREEEMGSYEILRWVIFVCGAYNKAQLFLVACGCVDGWMDE